MEEAVESTFVDSTGHRIQVQTRAGDYVIADEDGQPMVTFDADRLVLTTNLGVERHGSISLDDPFLAKQTGLQAIAVDLLEKGQASVVERDGRPIVRAEYREAYTFDEQEVINDHIIEIDEGTGLIVRHDIIRLSPSDNAGSETPPAGTVRARPDLDTSTLVLERTATTSFDDGFERLSSIDEAAGRSGHTIPDFGPLLPDGYTLSQIAYSDRPADREDRQNMVVLTYRNWAWRIDVTFRDASSIEAGTNPFDPDGRFEPVNRIGDFSVYRGDLLVPTHAVGELDGNLVTLSGAIGVDALSKVLAQIP